MTFPNMQVEIAHAYRLPEDVATIVRLLVHSEFNAQKLWMVLINSLL